MSEVLAVERSLVIAAEREQVWRAITTPEQISRWFDGQMRWAFALEPGAVMTFSMDEPIGYGTVVAVEPPERFVFRWTPEPGNPVESLVTFRLDVVPEGTRVTVTESGFEALPESLRQKRAEMNAAGWGFVLEHLAAYVAVQA